MTQMNDEVQRIFEQNAMSEFFLQQPKLLLRQAESQQEEFKYGMIALLEKPVWDCADVLQLCK